MLDRRNREEGVIYSRMKTWVCVRAAQCIDKEIMISKNGNIDIDIEID